MKKNLTKLCSALIAVVFMAGLFTGCGGSGDKNADGTTIQQKNGQAEGTTATRSDSGDNSGTRKHLKIVIEVPDMPDVIGTKDRVTQYVMDKFNVEFEFIAPSYGEQMEKLRMIMASGSLPDMIHTWGTGDGDHNKWVKDGLIMDITSYLADYPNVKAVTDNPNYQIWKADDHWFGVPKYYASMYPWGFQIRTDWLEKLNLKTPATTDELYDVLKAFVKADPDGKKNVGLTDNFDFFISEFLVPAFTGISGWGLYNGEYIQSIVHPGYMEYLKYMNKLYSEGLLDPDFMLNKDGNGVEKFLAGRAGVLSYNIDANIFNKTYDTLVQNFPNAKLGIMSPPKGPQGSFQPGSAIDANAMICFTADAEPDKVKRMLEIMDFLYSEEGTTLTRYGIEGIHYTKDGDRFVVNEAEKKADMKKTGDIVWSTGPHVLSIIAAYDYTRFLAEDTPRREILAPAYENALAAKTLSNPVTGYLPKSLENNGTKIADVLNTYVAKFITGKLNIDENWQKYLNDLDGAGYQEVKADMNKYLTSK